MYGRPEWCFAVGGSCDFGDVISSILTAVVVVVAIAAIVALVVYLLIAHIRDRFPSAIEESSDGQWVSKGNGGMSASSQEVVRVSRLQQGRRGPDEISDSDGAGKIHSLSSAWRPTRPQVSRAAEERQIQLRIEQGRRQAEIDETVGTRGRERTSRRGKSETSEDKNKRLRRETNRWLPGYYRRSRDMLE